jgi:hypothetical protein
MALRSKEAMFNAEIGDWRVIEGFRGTRDALGRLGLPSLVLSRVEPNLAMNGTAIGSNRRRNFTKSVLTRGSEIVSRGYNFAESAGMIFGR